MKEIFLGGLAVAGVGVGVYNYPTDSNTGENVYAMSQNQAIDKLRNTPLPIGYGPFSNGKVEEAASANDAVTWSSSDEEGGITCTAETESDGKDEVLVRAFCTSDSETNYKTADTMLEVKNLEFREHVDATLTGRKYDKVKIEKATIHLAVASIPKIASDAGKLKDDFQETLEETIDNASEAAADYELEKDIDQELVGE